MNRCDFYEAHWLEYLYDLLDTEEIAKLQQHLEGCEQCRASLAKAEQQQAQLAAAAKLSFPNVTFATPDESETIGGGTFVLASPWLRWAVAAGILLVLGGLTVSGGIYSWQNEQVRIAEARLSALQNDVRQLDEQYEAHVAVVEREFDDARKEIQELNERFPKQLMEVASAKDMHLVLTGPRVPEAGAVNRYTITTVAEHQRVPAQIAVKVLDDRQQIVYRAEGQTTAQKAYELELPPTLPFKMRGGLALEIAARSIDGQLEPIAEHLSLMTPRYRVHLATDKPMYQLGETVRFRALALEAFSLRPVQEDLQLIFTLTKPDGSQVELARGIAQAADAQGVVRLGPDQRPIRGIGTGEYQLDPSGVGGEFILEVREADNRFQPQRRKFLVNEYQKPRLNKELEFTRRSYGPGDLVTATCKATTVDGNRPLAGRTIRAFINVDGTVIESLDKKIQTDATGTADLHFQLPKQIDKGNVSVSVSLFDGGTLETLVRPVPLVLKKVQVEFYPEGGDLVAGVPNRVYFQARTTLGKPAELKGQVLDEQGKAVADVRTFSDPAQPGANHGMGVFTLTPQAGKKYRLHIEEPAGIEAVLGPSREFLPEARAEGVVLSVARGVIGPQELISAQVRSTGRDRALYLGAYCRGRLLDSQRVEAKAGQSVDIQLSPETAVAGVYRVTVFEESGASVRPVAERLLYRTPDELLKLQIQTDKKSYVPGEKVKLTFTAETEKKPSAGSILMVAVTDKSVHKLADDRTARQLPTDFLLTSDIQHPEDLEFADFLLSNNPSAAIALDLLLGTQGWRRFTEQNQRPQPPVFAAAGAVQDVQRIDFHERKLQQLKNGYEQSFAAAQAKVMDAERRAAVIRRQDQGFLQEQRVRLENACTAAAQDCQTAMDRLNSFQEFGRRLRGWLMPAVSLLLLAGLIACLLRGISMAQALPYLATAGCSLALWGFVTSVELGAGAPDMIVNAAKFDQPIWMRRDAGVRVTQAERFLQEENRKRLAVAEMLQPMANFAPQIAEGRGRGKVMPMATFQAKAGQQALPGAMAVRPIGLMRNHIAGGGARAARPLVPPAAAPVPERGAVPLPAFIVREYAHIHASGEAPTRSDFTETLLWNPLLVLANGKAEVSFELCDSVTTFQVLAAGHTLDGRLGAVTAAVESRLPLTLEPKLPKEVTAGDVVDLPLAIANNSDSATKVRVEVHTQGLTLVEGPRSADVELKAGRRDRHIYRFRPQMVRGEARVQFAGTSGAFVDRTDRSFRIVPQGFPVIGVASDVLDKSVRTEIVLPAEILPGTLECRATVYPSTLADLQQGLEALLREPHGCFEQTSSSNYPNLLILNYLKEGHQAKPEVARRAQELLRNGYAKLTSFECQDAGQSQRRGYEWFGGTAAPHEALTAYGLMQFRDMARVHDVDPAMLQRTYHYLLSRKNGKGGFERNQKALDHFGRAPQHITDAYIVWALSEDAEHRNVEDFARELAAVHETAKTSKDAYFLALVANSLLNCGRDDNGFALLQRLAEAQQPDGHLDAAETSITGSRGRDLQIETTALALLAWLKSQQPETFTLNVQRGVRWIGQQRGGYGGFGSTQSTILALKALIAFAKANKKPPEAGDLILFIGNQEIARQHFESEVIDAIALDVPNAEQLLHAGKNDVRLEVTGRNVFPYSVTWAYRTLKPQSAENCPVRLQTKLDRTQLQEGETTRLNVLVENVSSSGQGMTVAVLGLPAGLELPEDLKQLKELALPRQGGNEPGAIAFWEIQGRELVLYWRDLAPSQRREVSVDLIARVPGEYRGPANRAYLYYNADHKSWTEPLQVAVTTPPK